MTTVGTWLPWLTDAPVFIDNQRIAAFYDAIVRPDAQTTEISFSQEAVSSFESELAASGTAALGLPGFLKSLLPSLEVEVASKRRKRSADSSGFGVTLAPVNNPYRQLIHLALHYAADIPDRIRVIDTVLAKDFDTDGSSAPRELVFIDAGPGSIVIPTALEDGNGHVHLLYKASAPAGLDDGAVPKFPESAETIEELYALRSAYWRFYEQHFSSRRSMLAVEDAAKTAASRIEWIDYRMPLFDSSEADDEGSQSGRYKETLHLHLEPSGHYPTGTFAYRFVRRMASQGMRIVATMQSGAHLDVLAVFDR